MSTVARAAAKQRASWTTSYPPLLMVAVVLFLLLVVLPSSLNLPQANPQTTPEFAPVPPDDTGDTPPQQGNLSTLSLASSGSLGAGNGPGEGTGGAGGDSNDAQGIGTGRKPSGKRCVGKPPRQTEDPNSPPCVAFFSGDNFGATYQGVTTEEIRVVVYYDGGLTYGSSKTETTPREKWHDIDNDPPQEEDTVFVRNLRDLSRYFNDRYQTYNRRVHFWIYFGRGNPSGNPMTPEGRRSEAAAVYDKVKPFAVMAYPYYGLQDDFVDSLAKRGVLNFGGILQRQASVFAKYPGLIWSFQPSVEQQAEHFASYVCSNVVGKPVSVGGNDADPDVRLHNGQPRRIGILKAADPRTPEYSRFAEIVAKRIEECGGSVVLTRTFNRAGNFTPNRGGNGAPQQNMAAFKQEGISTIIWPQGYENEHSNAAAGINYRPEWVIAGDQLQESNVNTVAQSQPAFDRHAYVVTTTPLVGSLQEFPCYEAIKEAHPDAPDDDIDIACEFVPVYDDLRQLFTGIQVAGPRLTPSSVDRGFHAIPRRPAVSNRLPACYYDPNDYTCVKDAQVEWWDPTGQSPSGDQGCWRMQEDGKRYLPGTWPNENLGSRRKDNDPCNGYSRLAQF